MTTIHERSVSEPIEVVAGDSLVSAIKAGMALCAFFLSVLVALG